MRPIYNIVSGGNKTIISNSSKSYVGSKEEKIPFSTSSQTRNHYLDKNKRMETHSNRTSVFSVGSNTNLSVNETTQSPSGMTMTNSMFSPPWCLNSHPSVFTPHTPKTPNRNNVFSFKSPKFSTSTTIDRNNNNNNENFSPCIDTTSLNSPSRVFMQQKLAPNKHLPLNERFNYPNLLSDSPPGAKTEAAAVHHHDNKINNKSPKQTNFQHIYAKNNVKSPKRNESAKPAKMSREIRLSGLSDPAIEPDITPIDLTPLEPVSTTTTITSTTTSTNQAATGGKQQQQEETKTEVSKKVTTKLTKSESQGDERVVPVSTVGVVASSKEVNVPVTTVSSSLQTSPYKSNISPRHTVITRRNVMDRTVSPYTNHQSSSSSYHHHHYAHSTSNMVSGAPISMRPTSVPSGNGLVLKETRQREKQQLSELNDRFASYVERVRFLEAQNKKLQMELGVLRGKWGQETKQIEKMYQIELDEARSVLNDTSKLKDGLQLKLDKSEHDLELIRKKYVELEEHLNKDKTRISTLQDQIAANESEIGLLRRRLQDLQDEEKRLKQETVRMMGEIQRVSSELEFEMKQRLMLENDKQNLEEQLLFLKEIHAKELDELKHLALQESGIDPSVFFKNELSSAIKEIREEYETLNQTQRNDLERWYRLRVTEIQRKNAKAITDTDGNALDREQARKLKLQVNDSKRFIYDLKAKNAELESRIRDLEDEIRREETESTTLMATKETEIRLLKDELTKIVVEYEDLMASKSDLEVEIRTYRKLLEGEENRDGLKQIVEGIEQRHRVHNLTSSGNASVNTNNKASQYPVYPRTSYQMTTAYTTHHQITGRATNL